MTLYFEKPRRDAPGHVCFRAPAMKEHTREEQIPDLSAAALREWSGHVESVMRGVAHSLNNRAAALSAMIELSKDPAEDTAVIASIMCTELDRVQSLVAIVRSMGPPRKGIEAFAPHEAVEEALAVLALHGEHRERPVTIDASSAPPTRVPRWMFVRSLVALGAAAAHGVGGKVPVHIAVVGDGQWVVARVDGANAGAVHLSPYAAELARAMGGDVLESRDGFRVPTLAALRQREGP